MQVSIHQSSMRFRTAGFIAVTVLALITGCGQSSGSSGGGDDSGGGSTTKSGQSSSTYRYAGDYTLSYIQATDLDYWDSYRFDVASGHCGFTMSGDGASPTGTWYIMDETNECFLEDEWGQQYPMIDASYMRLDVSNLGSVTGFDSEASEYSTDNTSSSTITGLDLTFGSQTALLKVVKELESGERYRYDYYYEK